MTSLRKSIENICDMLVDRKCERPVVNFDTLVLEYPITIDTVKRLSKSRKKDEEPSEVKTDDVGEPIAKNIRVKWIDVKVNRSLIQQLLAEIEEDRISRLILVVTEPVSSQSNEVIKALRFQGKIIETFEFVRTLINPTRHKLVPRHELRSTAQTEILCKEWGTTKDQLPKIHTTDPIAKWYGAKPGQVFAIFRPSETLKETVISYRIVVI